MYHMWKFPFTTLIVEPEITLRCLSYIHYDIVQEIKVKKERKKESCLLALSVGQRLCAKFYVSRANFLTPLRSHLDVTCSCFFGQVYLTWMTKACIS